MCGRYNILPDARAWVDGWRIARDILDDMGWSASYNIAPSHWVPIIRATAGGDELVIDKARWGFVPHWVKDEKPKAQPINARDDTIATKPYFRDSFRHRRCLFPASGFFEWQAVGGSKQPYNIVLADGQPFLMAGIWDTWNGDDTAAIITTRANALMAPIHDRMPVIVLHEQAADWIRGEHPETFLHPFDAAQMRAYRIGKAVNNPRNNDAQIIESVDGGNVAPGQYD